MTYKALFYSVCAFILWYFTGCKPAQNDHKISVVFYNCENLFDTLNNPDKDDDDFTPAGKYHYTQKVYEQKLHNIAIVLQSMSATGSKGEPALIGLAEIENKSVLEELVHQPELARKNYQYLVTDGPDRRGINVGLIYNSKSFRVLHYSPIHVYLSGTSTRDILYVRGILGTDTVDVLVNHWPSKRGGEDETDEYRKIVAEANRRLIDSCLQTSKNARIILMGDLNDNPDAESICHVLRTVNDSANCASGQMYNPWARIFNQGRGTEIFDHHWNLFDQVMVSGTLLDNKSGHWHYSGANIYNPEFIRSHHFGHENEPHRSFAGTHWINGYSDHFPVMVTLER